MLFKRSLYLFLLVTIALFSCVKHKSLVLLKSNQDGDTDSIQKELNHTTYIIQPGDLLSIKVSSIDPSSVAIFNKEIGLGRSNQTNESSIYLSSYLVSDSGTVNFPIIGQVDIQNKSIREATLLLEKELAVYYKFVSVDVKLMSFRISILGEVKNPNTYTFFNENVNIIQALSKAGGLTDHGNSSKIKLVRQENHKIKVKILSLKDDEILNTEYYYLQPNDALYVEPLKIKAIKVNTPTIQLALSTLTFLIVISNYIIR